MLKLYVVGCGTHPFRPMKDFHSLKLAEAHARTLIEKGYLLVNIQDRKGRTIEKFY